MELASIQTKLHIPCPGAGEVHIGVIDDKDLLPYPHPVADHTTQEAVIFNGAAQRRALRDSLFQPHQADTLRADHQSPRLAALKVRVLVHPEAHTPVVHGQAAVCLPMGRTLQEVHRADEVRHKAGGGAEVDFPGAADLLDAAPAHHGDDI